MLNKVWKFFCSAKLTVVLFVLILIPSIVGTVIQQDINMDDPSFSPNLLYKLLGFYDIYHDPRFIFLLVMLALNTLVCTINRFRAKWNLVGMLMTHVGLLMILLGAVIGATLGVKGFMAIGEGETLDHIRVGAAMDESAPIPFEIRLLDFILDIHEEPTHRLVIIDMRTNEQQSRHIEPGKSLALSEPKWAGLMSLFGIKPGAGASVTPKRFLANAALVTSLTEGPEQTGMQAVEMRLKGSGGEHRGFTVSGSERPYSPRGTHMGVFYEKLDADGNIDARIEEAVASTAALSRIEVVSPNAALTGTYGADLGNKFDVEGYTVEVLSYVADFIIGEGNMVTSRSKFPHNPALQVRVTDLDGASSEQWLFAKYPGMHTPENGPPFEMKFVRSGRDDHIEDLVLILNQSDAGPIVAHSRGGKLIKRAELAEGETFSIEGMGLDLFIENFYENANVNREMKVTDDVAGRAAVEIEIEQDGKREDKLLWIDTPLDVPGYRLVYVQNKGVRDFYSVLQVVDGGEVVVEKKIEVNDPLRYGGYTFYQSSYDSKGLSWSGLQVRNDPGVPLVYGGFAVQLLGMIVIFYINPLIRKVKKGRA